MRQFILDDNRGLIEVELWKEGPNGSKQPDLDALLRAAEALADIEKRRVAVDQVGSYGVSTVFLGVDTSNDPDGPPIVFETMVFDREHESPYTPAGITLRYSSWEEAERGHAAVVEHLKGEVAKANKAVESGISSSAA